MLCSGAFSHFLDLSIAPYNNQHYVLFLGIFTFLGPKHWTVIQGHLVFLWVHFGHYVWFWGIFTFIKLWPKHCIQGHLIISGIMLSSGAFLHFLDLDLSIAPDNKEMPLFQYSPWRYPPDDTTQWSREFIENEDPSSTTASLTWKLNQVRG